MTISIAIILTILSGVAFFFGRIDGKRDDGEIASLGGMPIFIVAGICTCLVYSNKADQDKLRQQYNSAIARKDYKIEIKTTMVDSTVVKKDTLVTVHLK